MKTWSFIGHRNCPREIKEVLANSVEDLIVNKDVHRFFVGTQGGFDKLVYDVLCELEEKYDIQTFVVLAYLNRTESNDDYDLSKSIFPDELTKTPPRFAIRKRNSFMIDTSDYIITYLNIPYSNTYRNIEEAKRKKKSIINLGNFDISNMLL